MSVRVLFIHLYNDFSGSPKVLTDVIKSLDRGQEYYILTSKSAGGFLDEFSRNTKYFNYSISDNRYSKLFKYLLAQLSIIYSVIKIRKKIDVVYINTLLPFGGAVAALLLRKKIIYHVHETYITPKLLYFFLKIMCQLSSNEIIFVSKYVKTEYLKCKNVSVIYNGVKPAGIVSKMSRTASDIFTVTMICSLKNYKGLMEFFNIATSFINSYNIKFILQLNASATDVKDYIVKNNIEIPSNIQIRTSNPELASLYLETDLLLNLTKIDECIETFGMTLVEAMTYGIPVIAPPMGGPTEIVEDGKQGFLIDSRDTMKVIDTIKLLNEDIVLYEHMSNSALSRSKLFSPSVFSDNINAVFKKL